MYGHVILPSSESKLLNHPPCNWARIPTIGCIHFVTDRLPSKPKRSPQEPILPPLEKAVPVPKPAEISQLSQNPFDTNPATLGFFGVPSANAAEAKATSTKVKKIFLIMFIFNTSHILVVKVSIFSQKPFKSGRKNRKKKPLEPKKPQMSEHRGFLEHKSGKNGHHPHLE